MKLDKVGFAQASCYALAMFGIVMCNDSHINKQIRNFQTQILNNDSSKYKEINIKTQKQPLQIKADAWEKAYTSMQDSIKQAGEAQKSYIIGGQSVKTK